VSQLNCNGFFYLSQFFFAKNKGASIFLQIPTPNIIDPDK